MGKNGKRKRCRDCGSWELLDCQPNDEGILVFGCFWEQFDTVSVPHNPGSFACEDFEQRLGKVS
jgi:hypothetical protein